MKKLIMYLLILAPTIITTALNAERIDDVFYQLDKKHFSVADSIIRSWESDSVQDPELYVAKINYHFTKSNKGIMHIDRDYPPEGEKCSFVSANLKDTFYLFFVNEYDSQEVHRALMVLDEGISLYPNRLDLWFGKAHICKEIGDFKAQIRVLTEAITYSRGHLAEMRWSKNQPIDTTNAFLPRTIHEYALEYYRTGEMYKFYKISLLLMNLLPQCPIGYSDMGIYYGEKNKWGKAIEYFLKGLKFDPNDEIILYNTAYAYKRLGNKAKAKSFYNKILSITKNENTKEAVREELRQLR